MSTVVRRASRGLEWSASAGAGASPVSPKAARGYLMVAGAFMLIGLASVLVRVAAAPESVLLTLRMGIGAVVLGALFARRDVLRQVVQPGVPGRLLLMGALSAGAVLLLFISVRDTDVAIGLFLFCTAPVYVAVLAPPLLGGRSEAVVYVALALALAGMAAIVAPRLVGGGFQTSEWGIVAGVVFGALLGLYTIVVKSVTRQVGAIGISLSEMTLDALFVLPLALWQVVGQGHGVTGRDLAIALLMGVLCTAIAYTLWAEGICYIPVQHASIFG